MSKLTLFSRYEVMLMLIRLIIMLEVSKPQQGLELVPVGIRSSRNYQNSTLTQLNSTQLKATLRIFGLRLDIVAMCSTTTPPSNF